MEEDNQITLRGSLEICLLKKGKSRKYNLQGVKRISVKEYRNRIYIRFKTDDNIVVSIPLDIKPQFVKVKRIIKQENETDRISG